MRKDGIERTERKKIDKYDKYRFELYKKNIKINENFFLYVIKKIKEKINKFDYENYVTKLVVIKETKDRIYFYSKDAEYIPENVIKILKDITKKEKL